VKRAPLLLVGLLLAAAGAASCAQMIGIQHYEVEPQGGGSTSWVCAGSDFISGGQCVPFVVSSQGGESDAGLDEAGVASITTCDPVSNIGCTGDDVCVPDADFGHYYCAPGSANPVPVCGVCDAVTPCGPGSFCLVASTICLQTCCSDYDCGEGHCDDSIVSLPDGVGLCVQ
jgi:hypothetical protein